MNEHLIVTTSYKLQRTHELMEEARIERFWSQQKRREKAGWWPRRFLPGRRRQLTSSGKFVIPAPFTRGFLFAGTYCGSRS